MTVVLKFDGQDANCNEAACGRDKPYSNFLADLAKNFMASDMTMQESFDKTKLGFVAKQVDLGIPKLPFAEGVDSQQQAIASVIQSGSGRSA